MQDAKELSFDEIALPKDHWLCKMDGYLDWRVIGPQINNPYEIAFPDRVLDAMSKHRDVVRSHIKVRCLCDGHEIMKIDNLAMPIIYTDHPCLIGTPRRLMVGFLSLFGVEDEIERVIDRVQEEVREELHKRELTRLATRTTDKSMKQLMAEKESKKKSEKGDSGTGGVMQVRVIRR